VIGVTYGYGPREELEAHEPTAIVDSVQELRELLLG
jgi:phosphoglycolate phosphatase-like HAD superfamily hydrolase